MSNRTATFAIVVLVAVAGALGYGVRQKMNSTSVGNQAVASPPAVATPDASENDTSNAPVAVFIGDFTSGSDDGGQGPKNFTSILVEDASKAMPLRPVAVGEGSGYVVSGAAPTFMDQVRRFVSPEDRVVLISGSRNDIVASPSDVRAVATETLELVRTLAPDANLLVIGPTYGKFTPSPEVLATRDAVKDAAAAASATFVDPLDLKWFTTGESGLIGMDNVHPTDLAHQRMAEYMTPIFAQALQTTTNG